MNRTGTRTVHPHEALKRRASAAASITFADELRRHQALADFDQRRQHHRRLALGLLLAAAAAAGALWVQAGL